MLVTVFGTRERNQVLRAVVMSDAVEVMDDVTLWKRLAVRLLPDDDVLSAVAMALDVLWIDQEVDVAPGAGLAAFPLPIVRSSPTTSGNEMFSSTRPTSL